MALLFVTLDVFNRALRPSHYLLDIFLLHLIWLAATYMFSIFRLRKHIRSSGPVRAFPGCP